MLVNVLVDEDNLIIFYTELITYKNMLYTLDNFSGYHAERRRNIMQS